MQLSLYKSAFMLILTVPTALNAMQPEITIQPKVGSPIKISLSTAQSSNLIKNLTSDPILDSTKSIPLDIDEQDIVLLLPFMELEKQLDKQKAAAAMKEKLKELSSEKGILLLCNANYLDMPILFSETKKMVINFFKQKPQDALTLIKRIQLPNDIGRPIADELAYPLLAWFDSPLHKKSTPSFVRLKGRNYQSYIRDACLSIDNNYAAAGFSDNCARIWSLKDMTLLVELPHPAVVHRIQFSPDAKLVLTGCADQQLRIWQMAEIKDKMTCLKTVYFDHLITSIVFNQNGTLAAFNTDDNILHVYDTESWQELRAIPGCVDTVSTNTGNLVVTKNFSDTRSTKIHILDMGTSRFLWTSEQDYVTNSIKLLCANATGEKIKIITMDSANSIKCWNSSSDTPEYITPYFNISAMCFTHGDCAIVAGNSYNGDIHIVTDQLKSGSSSLKFGEHNGQITKLCCNSEDQCLSCSTDGSIILWDLQSHDFAHELKGKLALEQALALHTLYKAFVENDKAQLKCRHNKHYAILNSINHDEFKQTIKKHIESLSSKWCWHCALTNNKVLIGGIVVGTATALAARYFYKKTPQ